MAKTAKQLDAEIAATLAKYAAPAEDNDAGTFYLTENSPTNPDLDVPEFRTFLGAKRAAMKLVRDGKYPGVEVWHRWRGSNYMQGVANEDGWSDV